MGKRSSFERIPSDFYPTPRKAVEPLVPYLRKEASRFAEPCAGEGHLVRHLESFGFRCVYQGDIAEGCDALEKQNYGTRADVIVTNPPHTRQPMHELIRHFQNIRPTWLLIGLDWVANLQAVPYLEHCSDIVIIGRVKWMEGSAFTGKENYAWYRFDGAFRGATRVHNDRRPCS